MKQTQGTKIHSPGSSSIYLTRNLTRVPTEGTVLGTGWAKGAVEDLALQQEQGFSGERHPPAPSWSARHTEWWLLLNRFPNVVVKFITKTISYPYFCPSKFQTNMLFLPQARCRCITLRCYPYSQNPPTTQPCVSFPPAQNVPYKCQDSIA